MSTRAWLRILAALAMSLAAVGFLGTGAAHADSALGGGTYFEPGAAFPFPAGSAGRTVTSMFVQNIGSETARVELTASVPEGVTVTPVGDPVTVLEPGETKDVEFAIETSETLTVGTYPVIVSLQQTNVPTQEGVTVFAPAVNGNLVVQVVGDTATVTVNVVNADDGSPASGQLTLLYVGPDGAIPQVTVEGSTLTQTVVPGDYQALFEIPGLTQSQEDFSVVAGEDKVVTMEVAGVQFIAVDVNPVLDADGAIVTADLVAAVRNNLREIDGPVAFNVAVARDGVDVEQFTMAELPVLPTGNTEQRATYRPPAGFEPGLWTFTFTISAGEFTVAAEAVPEFTVPTPLLESTTTYVVAGVAGALVIGALAWLIVARRRRRRDRSPSHAA